MTNGVNTCVCSAEGVMLTWFGYSHQVRSQISSRCAYSEDNVRSTCFLHEGNVLVLPLDWSELKGDWLHLDVY